MAEGRGPHLSVSLGYDGEKGSWWGCGFVADEPNWVPRLCPMHQADALARASERWLAQQGDS